MEGSRGEGLAESSLACYSSPLFPPECLGDLDQGVERYTQPYFTPLDLCGGLGQFRKKTPSPTTTTNNGSRQSPPRLAGVWEGPRGRLREWKPAPRRLTPAGLTAARPA